MANLNLLWWTWICLSEFDITVVNLKLPQWTWIWNCAFEFEVLNLNLQLWIWICHDEFEIHCDPQMPRQNFLIHGKTLNSFHNTLLFGAKFLIIWATHFNNCKIFFLAARLSSSWQNFLPHGKTFFLTAKLSSSRQNFLTKAKLPFSWQPFKSKANLSYSWQNFSWNMCTTFGAPLGEDDGEVGSDSFIDTIFSGLCPL